MTEALELQPLSLEARIVAARARIARPEWRAPVYRDLVLDDVLACAAPPTVLDIGCGRGFDNDSDLQRSLAEHAGRFLGLDPSLRGPAPPWFDEAWGVALEDAPIPDGSIDVAYAVMVLEHVRDAAPFWNTVFRVLRPGGVFWGFTTDSRHYACTLSLLAERLRLKTLLLPLIYRGTLAPYENYPTFYRNNTPGQIAPHVRAFASATFASFGHERDVTHLVPKPLRPIVGAIEKWRIARGRPGSNLAVRLVR